VRVYLKDMGRVMLLTKEGEVRLARKIIKGKRLINKGLVLSPVFLESIVDLERKIRTEPESVREVFELTEEEVEGPKLGVAVQEARAKLKEIENLAHRSRTASEKKDSVPSRTARRPHAAALPRASSPARSLGRDCRRCAGSLPAGPAHRAEVSGGRLQEGP
jgi:RNA polymerase primary sigma factor